MGRWMGGLKGLVGCGWGEELSRWWVAWGWVEEFNGWLGF